MWGWRQVQVPVPKRVWERQVHGGGDKDKERFMDLMMSQLSSLEWKEDECQKVNPASTLYDPIPIYCMAKSKENSTLFVGDESGKLHVLSRWFELKRKGVCFTNTLNITETSAVTTVKNIGRKIILGTGSGLVMVLDGDCLIPLDGFEGHLKGVKKVDSIDGALIISCGKDNRICVYDTRMKIQGTNPVNVIMEAHSIVREGGNRGRRKLSDVYGSTSNSVTDFVFLDNHRIISAGSSDGRLKEWDLRLSYKQLKKCHPVQVVEYPASSNIRGYSSLKIWGNKLYSASVNHDIYRWDTGTMVLEATFWSPSRISNHSKFDVSSDGNFLATGSGDAIVHIFSTQLPRKTGNNVPVIKPFKSLNHDPIAPQYAVCCPLFNPLDDSKITTGGDASILAQWLPSIYVQPSRELEKEAVKKELEAGPKLPLKTEFHHLTRAGRKTLYLSPKKTNNKENILRSPVCFAKLDSFPNYVIDGMRLPHVCPKIRIKLKPKSESPFSWALSPQARQMALKSQQEVTPKLKTPQSRKRRKVSNYEDSSPKIPHYFSVIPVNGNSLSSPVASLKIKSVDND